MNEFLSMIKMFSTSYNNSNTTQSRRTVITKLKFIGTLQPHEKIDSRNLKIESTSILTPIKRLILGDSRETTIYFFSSTIERSFEIIDATKTTDKMFCANMISDLIKSVKGLKAAQKTYNEDKLIICEIDTIIESIQRKIYEIRKEFPEIYSEENIDKNKYEIQDTTSNL